MLRHIQLRLLHHPAQGWRRSTTSCLSNQREHATLLCFIREQSVSPLPAFLDSSRGNSHDVQHFGGTGAATIRYTQKTYWEQNCTKHWINLCLLAISVTVAQIQWPHSVFMSWDCWLWQVTYFDVSLWESVSSSFNTGFFWARKIVFEDSHSSFVSQR